MQWQHLLAVCCALLLGCSIPVARGLDNGLGLKPPMGWNTWNNFGCNINETVVRSAADRLLDLGLAALGYVHVNIDDCWQSHERTPDGRLQADPTKFPSGMPAIAAHIHERGLKFGTYSDAGSLTCAGYPGSRHHEDVDAATFAAWGVDFLKYDNCYASNNDVLQRYTDMRDALNRTGRPIYYSMCNQGAKRTWEWAGGVGNSWRTYEDIFPNWPSMLRSLDYGAAGLAAFAGPQSGFNDPDMLEIGVAPWTMAQQRSHFALWALVKAPLIIGADLAAIGPDSLSVLLSKEVIAINQDDLGVAGDVIWKRGAAEVWATPLSGNARAVILFNRGTRRRPLSITVTWAQLGYGPDAAAAAAAAGGAAGARPAPVSAVVRDLYAEADLGVYQGGFTATVQPYDVAVLRVTPMSSSSSGGSTQQQPASSSSQAWRPWTDPAAAALQARMRAATARARRWDARKAAWLAAARAHAYVLALAVAAAAAAALAAGVAVLRRHGGGGRLMAAALPRCSYQAVARSDDSSTPGASRTSSIALSRQSSPVKQLLLQPGGGGGDGSGPTTTTTTTSSHLPAGSNGGDGSGATSCAADV